MPESRSLAMATKYPIDILRNATKLQAQGGQLPYPPNKLTIAY